MAELFDLSGRIALITGGSKGIGRMIAEEFVRRGVRTYVTAHHADVCQQTATELSEFGDCIAIPNDLSALDGVNALAAELKARESQLDILVNNAGTGWGAPFDEFPEKGWDKTLNLNLKAVFFLTQQLAPLLRASASAEQPAKVINISSVDGLYVAEDESYSYTASKAGLNHLTRRLAKRLAKEHIHVNAIAPGAFVTDMNALAREQPELLNKFIPASRIGRPEDIAGTVVYMASRAGDYLVGITLAVDGGLRMRFRVCAGRPASPANCCAIPPTSGLGCWWPRFETTHSGDRRRFPARQRHTSINALI